MRLYSWNVNGIRAVLKKGLLDWLDETTPDILCLQETRATPDQVDTAPLEARGAMARCTRIEPSEHTAVTQHLTVTRIAGVRVDAGCRLAVSAKRKLPDRGARGDAIGSRLTHSLVRDRAPAAHAPRDSERSLVHGFRVRPQCRRAGNQESDHRR